MSVRVVDWRSVTLAGVSGALFAVGLALGGMTRPSKVIGFLDVAGEWDASLAFVMGGAVLVYGVGYWRVRRWHRPFFREEFLLPAQKKIDTSLLLGAVLFGAGWGIAGFCPGPALVSTASLDWRALIFVVSMLVAMAAARIVNKVRQ